LLSKTISFQPWKINKHNYIMKLLHSILALSALAGHATASDCSIPVSREINGGDSPVCLHFGGVSPQGYHAWYNANGISVKYSNYVYMPGSDPAAPHNGVAVHWNIDGDYVNIAVAARATGWVGFGLAEAGGMIGADMVLFTASNPDSVVDAYTDDERNPKVDDCSGDWELMDSNVDLDNGFIMFEARRLLDTEDPQDRAIVNDASTLVPPHRVIAAWGDSEAVGYHGLNRARGAIRFFGLGNDLATFRTEMARSSEATFEVRSMNHEIAAMETEYAYTCLGRDELIDAHGLPDTEDQLYIIGFEPILSPETEAYVHHFIVYASSEGNCTEAEDSFGEIAYVWAPGEGPLAFPDNMGSPLFGSGHQSFNIEVHYNNPLMTPGILDSSGVRFYYTTQPRAEEVGVLPIGDPEVNLYGQSVGAGLTLHEFDCPGSCSDAAGQPVTVLREYLHMHKEGLAMRNQQIRNGEVVREGKIDYWEFDQNGNAAILQDPFVVQPGDSFKTSCYFNAPTEDTVFGKSSSEEMCMAFLYYYPRVQIAVPISEFIEGVEGTFEFPWMCGYDIGVSFCETTHKQENLSDSEEVGRLFGIENDQCSSDEPSPSEDDSDDSSDDSAAASNSKLLVAGAVMMLAGFAL
jgi:hypothetical protein